MENFEKNGNCQKNNNSEMYAIGTNRDGRELRFESSGGTMIECSHQELIKLDLSNCKELAILYCMDNELTKLDLSDYTSLELIVCNGNQLTELNLSNCKELTDLDCSKNKLTELDSTNCDKLKNKNCLVGGNASNSYTFNVIGKD